MRKMLLTGVVALLLAVLTSTGASAARPSEPGATGIGDPYFPLDGNGGYDVKHYDLTLGYTPKTHTLVGTARIEAKATSSLSSFDLDLVGLTVDRVRVNGLPARWVRQGQELKVTPPRPLHRGRSFVVTVDYHGKPRLLDEPALGQAGVFPTSDGAVIAGEPHVAATWFPVNDHPLDKATYTFRVSVPRGVEAIANGRLVSQVDTGSRTVWTWQADAPMASYLATATIGQFDVHAYEADGIQFWDAIDPTLFATPKPPRGRYVLAAGEVDGPSYQRLTRVITVPKSGGRLTFKAYRGDSLALDSFVVEAHPVGSDAWTTLVDRNEHTDPFDPGFCPDWLETHPFLRHYQTPSDDFECAARGTTGTWNPGSIIADGWESWSVDLKAYAGRQVEVALTVVTQVETRNRVLLDDVVGPGGQGTTSFEPDSNPLDGWVRSGPPPGSPVNTADWSVITPDQVRTTGDVIRETLDRQPAILRFLSGIFGPYPFQQAGGIVDNDPGLGFALENQTRPIYDQAFFRGATPDDAQGVVVHELAHQWVGDSVSVAGWRDIWLNEGFASYAEWLFSERTGGESAADIFSSYSQIEAGSRFWASTIGDPGPDGLFDDPVYTRGAMTLQALRAKVGDQAFFAILRSWTTERAGGHGTTSQFVALAERIAGVDLDPLFTEWLFTPARPASLPPPEEPVDPARVRADTLVRPEHRPTSLRR